MKCALFINLFVGLRAALAAPAPATEPTSALKRSLENRESLVTVGFRTVDSNLARLYASRGDKLFYNSMSNSRMLSDVQQLGPGVYLSPGPGDYRINGANDWVCWVLCDQAEWNEVPKVWIDRNEWWPNSASDIVSFVRRKGFSTWASRAARLSVVDEDRSNNRYSYSNAGKHQMLLPPLLVNSLTFNTECWSYDNQPDWLEDYRLDYNDLQNMHGSWQYPE